MGEECIVIVVYGIVIPVWRAMVVLYTAGVLDIDYSLRD